MSDKHKISEFIDNISFKKTLGGGFRPDEVYDTICQLTSMYNEVLADSYKENDELKKRLESQTENGVPGSHIKNRNEKEHREMLSQGISFTHEIDFVPDLDGVGDLKKNFIFDELEETEETVEIRSEDTEAEEKTVQATVREKRERRTRQEKSAMTEKELQRMKRSELLELLIDQSKENERLKTQISMLEDEVDELSERLKDRAIKIEKAGTLAEASILINGVLESASAAAQQYLENLQQLSEREERNCTKKEAETEEYVQRMIADAKRQCDGMLKNAEDRCSAMTYVTQQQCSSMKAEAQEYCRKLEEEVKKKCEELETFTRKKCEVREKQTEERCASLDEKTQQETAKCWDDMTKRMDEFYKMQEYLRNLFSGSGQSPRT